MITWASIGAFQEKYVTLADLSRTCDVVPGVVYNRLKKRGITPVVDEKRLSKFYKRAHVEDRDLFLLPLPRKPHKGKTGWVNFSSLVPEAVEISVIEAAVANPTLGFIRLSKLLAQSDIAVSAAGVGSALRRTGLATKEMRQQRAEQAPEPLRRRALISVPGHGSEQPAE